MKKKLLVPTDFSDPSKEALKYAFEFGKYIGADELHLLNAAYVPVNPAGSLVSMSRVLVEDGEKQFETLKSEIANWPESKGFMVKTKVSIDDVLTSLKNYAKEYQPDYVIMGTKGASGVEEFLFGTTAAEVLENSEVPVVIVPPGVKFEQPQHIVFAADLKDIGNMEVLAPLKNFVIGTNAKLVLLHISKDVDLTEIESKEKEDLQNYFHGLDVTFTVLHSENIYTGVEVYMQDNEPDMVAVLSRRYNFLQGIFHASISKKIAHRTWIPMLSLRNDT